MKLNFIYIFILISNLTFGQISADTITNWQIYKDNQLIITGNEVMQIEMLPASIIDIQDKFENLRIDFRYDFFSGDIERKIGFYTYDNLIGEFTEKSSARESIKIPKDFILKTFNNHFNKQLQIRYSDNKFNTYGISIGLIIFTNSNCLTKQEFNKTLIERGEFKNYFQFDLGDFYFLNGRFENNLTYKIQQKDNEKKVYTRKDSLSDAMILKPKFFCNSDKSTILIMIEVASEYSWGQEIILTKNRDIKYLGYLDYAVDKDMGESISDYCDIMCENGKLIMIFKDISIIYRSDESNLINGKDLQFEITEKGINRIK